MMARTGLSILASGAFCAAAVLLTPVSTQATILDTDPTASIVLYEVDPGDTLSEIAANYLRPDLTWRHLRAVNQLADGDRLVPGARLRIPRSWLRNDNLQAQISERRGRVQILNAPGSGNDVVEAGSDIRTGADGVVVISLPDGTTLRVAPESRVRIDRLRRSRGEDAIDARFDIQHGEVTVDAPSPATKSKKRRIQLRTPKAIAAVRGTRFRVRESSDRATNAVLRGAVNWQGSNDNRALSAGYGSSADTSGRTTEPETLLPAPVLSDRPEPIPTPETSISFPPIPGARAYRLLISRDANALDAVAQKVLITNAHTFESPDDGPFYFRIRAISANGIDGYSSQMRVEFSARPPAPTLDPGQDSSDDDGLASLSWPTRDDAEAYEVQVAETDAFDTIAHAAIVDRPPYRLDTKNLSNGPGAWFWRVAGIGVDGKEGPRSSSRRVVRETVGPPVNAQVKLDQATLNWQTPAAVTTLLRVDPQTNGASPMRLIETGSGNTLRIDDLAPGRYQAAVIMSHANGRRSAPGPATDFTVPLLLRDSSGKPVIGANQAIRMLAPW